MCSGVYTGYTYFSFENATFFARASASLYIALAAETISRVEFLFVGVVGRFYYTASSEISRRFFFISKQSSFIVLIIILSAPSYYILFPIIIGDGLPIPE